MFFLIFMDYMNLSACCTLFLSFALLYRLTRIKLTNNLIYSPENIKIKATFQINFYQRGANYVYYVNYF